MSVNVFDKTMQTFFVGGIASFVTLLIMRAPLFRLISDPSIAKELWMSWLADNIGGIMISESVVIVFTLMIINEYLVTPFAETVNLSV